jgi:homoaconitase/3-isopropylmalate dehydratase large subunit
LVLGLVSCKAQSTATPPAEIAKVLKFTNDNFDMGKIVTGKPTEFTVDIENISSAPITLTNVMVGCGCTTPKYTQGQVIAPNTHATVVLGFNGRSRGLSSNLFYVPGSNNVDDRAMKLGYSQGDSKNGLSADYTKSSKSFASNYGKTFGLGDAAENLKGSVVDKKV